MSKTIKVFFIAAFILSISACTEDALKIKYYPTIEEKNTGALDIYCDEDLKSIIEQQIEIFVLNYPNANVHPVFLSEKDLVEKLLNGTIRTAILSRNLTKAETEKISQVNEIKCSQHVLAKSALVLVANKSVHKTISDAALKALFTDGKTQIIVEGKESNRLQIVRSELGINSFGKQIFAMNSLDSIINYLEQNQDAVGVIDYANISDENAARTIEILSKISVLKINTYCDSIAEIVSANPNDIYTGCYPLVAPINYVLTDLQNKVAGGFLNFLIKPKSSRIFLRGGFIPFRLPEREIVIDTSAVKGEKI